MSTSDTVAGGGSKESPQAGGHEPMTALDHAMLAELVDTVRCHPAAAVVTWAFLAVSR